MYAHAWCSEHLSECMPHSPQKMHMHPCMRAHATMQKLLCHGNCCELILSLLRASYSCLPPALLLSRPNQSPDAVRSRNLSKSTLAHDVVAAAMSRKHYSVMCVGAGLFQLSMIRTRAWPRTSSSTRLYFHFLSRGLLSSTQPIDTWCVFAYYKHFCAKWSFAVSLLCMAHPRLYCAVGAHLEVGLAELSTREDFLELYMFSFHVLGEYGRL